MHHTTPSPRASALLIWCNGAHSVEHGTQVHFTSSQVTESRAGSKLRRLKVPCQTTRISARGMNSAPLSASRKKNNSPPHEVRAPGSLSLSHMHLRSGYKLHIVHEIQKTSAYKQTHKDPFAHLWTAWSSASLRSPSSRVHPCCRQAWFSFCRC